MWFDMESDVNGEICQIALHRYRSEASGVKLDEYLVPVFHWEDIEEEAERIIADLVPEGLNDPSRLRPYPFAERLGLKIVSLPLYKRPKTASILFFGPGEVLTDSDADAPPVSVAVEANTIVLNSHLSGREKDAIFHECFHYVEHRLFFKLQQLHNNDLAAIGRWRQVSLKEGRRSPIEWIEWQANVGSQCLQVPQALLRKCVNEALNDMKNIRDYIAQKLLAPEAAKNTVQRLGTVMASLSQMPKRVPLIEEEPWRSEGVRVRAVRNFLIYFWVNEAEKTVQIIAVIYARRDQTSVLSQLDLQ